MIDRISLNNITLEKIGQSLALEWEIAHKAETYHEWETSWNSLFSKLGAYVDFINYARDINFPVSNRDRKIERFMEEIWWLMDIVREIRCNY